MSEAQIDQPNFDWIPFFGELAAALVEYRAKQQELIDFLKQLRDDGHHVIFLEDMDEHGNRFLLKQIDGFTFFSNFNRGITTQKRVRMLEAMRTHFRLSCATPDDFPGVPLVNNQ